MSIDQIPEYTGEVPVIGQEQNEFNTNTKDQLDFFNQQAVNINTFATQANALGDSVEVSEQNAASSAAVAASNANFAGNWSDATGVSNRPISYRHNGKNWQQLAETIPDITLDEPQENAFWTELSNVVITDIINPNLISNSGFEIAGSVVSPPDATPRAYSAGDELFAGMFAVGPLTGVTYVNGLLGGIGQLYTDIYKTAKQKDSTSDFTPSIAGSNGNPYETGVTVVDNGDYWRVTFDMTNTFSVKLEQGSVATGHKTKSLFDIYGHPNMGIYDARAYGAKYDGASDDTQAHKNAIIAACRGGGGVVQLGYGETVISDWLRDDILDPSKIGKTITLQGFGASEDQANSGKVTTLNFVGGVGIHFDGNRSGGRDFSIVGDGGAYTEGADNIISDASRAQWRNIVSTKARGDGFRFRFGNSSSFQNLTLINNAGNGFNPDGTGYIDKNGASRPNDLNASTMINIDSRANGLIGVRTGVNSGFANNYYQVTCQGNGGVGMEFNGDYNNVFGFYGEANDVGGSGLDIRFSATADNNRVYGNYSNVTPSWEDLSVNQRNYIVQYRDYTEEQRVQRLILGESTSPAGTIIIDGEGDGTNPSIRLQGTSTNQTVDVYSEGSGTLKFDFKDGIVLPPTIAPALQGSWTNVGGSRMIAGYYKDAAGVAHLQGVITGGSGAGVELIFTLPSGYRNSAREYFSTVASGAFASIFIDADGNVYADSGSGTELSLSGISFRAV